MGKRQALRAVMRPPEGLNNETGAPRQKDPGLDAIVTAHY
jgi:hypothetical protein